MRRPGAGANFLDMGTTHDTLGVYVAANGLQGGN